MIKSKPEKSIENVCDLNYLTEMMGGKKTLIKEIMDVFLKQIPEELRSMNAAITKTDYPIIKSCAHTMRSWGNTCHENLSGARPWNGNDPGRRRLEHRDCRRADDCGD